MVLKIVSNTEISFYHRPQPKLREGYVFTRVKSVHKGYGYLPGPYPLLGPYPLPEP